MPPKKSGPTISFDFITPLHVRAVLEEYYNQAAKALEVHSYLGAVVGFGAVAEGVLTWALKNQESRARAATKAPKVSNRAIEKWRLETLLDVAREIGLIKEDEQAIRNWRNLVHPYRRVKGSPRLDHALALSAFRSVARIAQQAGGAVAIDEMVPAEMNFSWLIEGRLAGCRGPACSDDLNFLEQSGIGALVRLVMPKEAQVAREGVLAAHLTDCHEPVEDFHPPDLPQLNRILCFINAKLAEGRAVAVSCGAGYGRTGTVLACWLIQDGKSAHEALDYLRKVRPDSAREIDEYPTHHQRDFILKFGEQHKR